MPLKVYKKASGIYYLRGTFQGQRVDRSLGTRDRQVAERLRQAEEQQIATEAIHGPASTTTFERAVIAYVQSGKSGRFLSPLVEYFAGRIVSQITRADLDEFAAKAYPDVSDSTINRQVYAPASAVLNFAADQGWRAPIRIRKRPEPKGRTRWLTVEEAEALVTHAGPLKLFVTLALESGARSGEILRLEWKDVDLDQQTFWLWESGTKTGKARQGHFGKRTRELMKPASGRVILNARGRPYRLYDESGSPIAETFKRACERAGLEGVSPHVLRHTWATWAMSIDPNMLRVKAYGGWSSTSQLERYAKLAPPGYGEKISKAGWSVFGRNV